MRSCVSKGDPVVNGNDVPLQNGVVTKEGLPTIQVDTVASPPLSPSDLSDNEEETVDESQIQLELVDEQAPDWKSEEIREDLKRYLEDILAKAMVVAQKKLQFVGVPSSDEEDEERAGPSTNQRVVEAERRQREEAQRRFKEEEGRRKEEDLKREEVRRKEAELKESEERARLEEEIREAAQKVVEEVLDQAAQIVAERLEEEAEETATEKEDFPGLPTFQIDTVNSAPPSPEAEEAEPLRHKKWTFKMTEDKSGSAKALKLITFQEAPDDVKEVASAFVKELVERAVTQAMEKEKTVPTVPFNFEDVDLMKTTGPWYVRMREAFVRVLRTACFCTPRRSDS